MIDYFGNKSINLDDGDIEGYREYLENKWLKDGKTGVPANTYKKHWRALRLVFKEAIKKKHLKNSDIPNLPIKNALKFQKKATWTEKELETKLIPALNEWVTPKRMKSKTEEYRNMLRAMFLLSIYTGIRLPHEAENLYWSDINENVFEDTGEKYIQLNIVGKTGDREPIANPIVKNILLSIKHMRNDLNQIHDDDIWLLNEPIFMYSDGTRPTSWSGSFRDFLREYNLRYDRKKLKRTLYSARSYFIIDQLQSDVSVFRISRQVGNSIKMIQDHYSNYIQPTGYLRDVTKIWQERRKINNKQDLLNTLNETKTK